MIGILIIFLIIAVVIAMRSRAMTKKYQLGGETFLGMQQDKFGDD